MSFGETPFVEREPFEDEEAHISCEIYSASDTVRDLSVYGLVRVPDWSYGFMCLLWT